MPTLPSTTTLDRRDASAANQLLALCSAANVVIIAMFAPNVVHFNFHVSHSAQGVPLYARATRIGASALDHAALSNF